MPVIVLIGLVSSTKPALELRPHELLHVDTLLPRSSSITSSIDTPTARNSLVSCSLLGQIPALSQLLCICIVGIEGLKIWICELLVAAPTTGRCSQGSLNAPNGLGAE